MKKIVLRRSRYWEHVISEGDFKHLHPNDFEDLHLLHLQGKLDHLPALERNTLVSAVTQWIRGIVFRQRVKDFQLGIESYQSQLNLTRPRWEARDMKFKRDYSVVESPRSVVFTDCFNTRMLMRLDEIHHFSDGTLTQVEAALDVRDKEYRIAKDGKYTAFWTAEVFQRNKHFLHAIRKLLLERRIFRSLECFVGRRIPEGDYRLMERTI